jgi:uncharacterized protein YlxP (DUF503 family)
MIVGVCTLELDLPGLGSLKQKRSCLKSLIAQVHRKFHVSLAEVDLHDVWQSSTLGAAVVSTTAPHAERVLESVVRWIEDNRPDVTVVDYHVETLHF